MQSLQTEKIIRGSQTFSKEEAEKLIEVLVGITSARPVLINGTMQIIHSLKYSRSTFGIDEDKGKNEDQDVIKKNCPKCGSFSCEYLAIVPEYQLYSYRCDDCFFRWGKEEVEEIMRYKE